MRGLNVVFVDRIIAKQGSNSFKPAKGING